MSHLVPIGPFVSLGKKFKGEYICVGFVKHDYVSKIIRFVFVIDKGKKDEENHNYYCVGDVSKNFRKNEILDGILKILEPQDWIDICKIETKMRLAFTLIKSEEKK